MKFKGRKYMYISVFSIMLSGMMIFSTNHTFPNKEEEVISTGSAVSVEPETNKVNSEVAVNRGLLMKDAYPEINQLIQTYFNAKLKVDKESIATCVDNVEYVGIERLPEIVDEMEAVDGIVCYTLEGPEKDSYVVYAYNQVKFKDVATKSSALDGFYVKKDETGKLKIILSPLSKEVQAIIEEDSKREDVASLISDVNMKLAKEVKSDKNLAKLLKKMTEKASGKGEKKEEKKAKEKK